MACPKTNSDILVKMLFLRNALLAGRLRCQPIATAFERCDHEPMGLILLMLASTMASRASAAHTKIEKIVTPAMFI